MPDQSIRAVVWERDGEILGVAGYYIVGGSAVLFSDVRPDAPKFAIWKQARKYMSEVRIPMICEADESSSAFLKRLGWAYLETVEGKDIYSWQPS